MLRMGTLASQFNQQNEPLELRIPEAALARLTLALGRARTFDEVWAQAWLHGAAPERVGELLDYWCDEFDFRSAETRFNLLPLYASNLETQPLVFVHLRSRRPDAIPLLLLHGSFGSPLEHAALFEALCDPAAHGGRASESFHVVCPALPGFGLSPPHAKDMTQVAEACAEMMAGLGYRRYVAHGCELGAAIARELAASDAQHLAGALIGDCPAYPDPDPVAVAQLSSREKSQLALLGELRQTAMLGERNSPVALLASALAQLADSDSVSSAFRDDLLFGLSLSLLGDGALQYRLRRARLRESPCSERPCGVCAFPLDAPSLRRFAERRNRIVHWKEHERGGCMPGFEQPQLLAEQLVEFCTRFR
jgi:pimeloyl-ACP methyl ester carboxylesterase